VSEQRQHDEIWHQQERNEARQRQEQRELDRAILGSACTGLIAARQASRHFRQQHRADRDTNHTDRQLVEPIGIIERGERASGKETCNHRVSKKRNLRPGGAKHGRT
jgi:hypothetical protein